MAVTSSVTIPAQPTAGLLDYIPLGGDGFTAPFAAWSLIGHSVTGDATAGAASLGCVMDMRFTSLVAFVSIDISQASAADADLRIQLVGSGVTTQAQNLVSPSISATVASNTIGHLWCPTPMILPGGVKDASDLPRISARLLNVDTDVYSMSALIYLFNIRVREVTPMGPLLWARGST